MLLIPLGPPPLPLCFDMVVNWGIISFGFVSITAGMTMPISAQGMYCLSEKKKKGKWNIINVQHCSTSYNQLTSAVTMTYLLLNKY